MSQETSHLTEPGGAAAAFDPQLIARVASKLYQEFSGAGAQGITPALNPLPQSEARIPESAFHFLSGASPLDSLAKTQSFPLAPEALPQALGTSGFYFLPPHALAANGGLPSAELIHDPKAPVYSATDESPATGLRRFVEKVQSGHHESKGGLCTGQQEAPNPFLPIFTQSRHQTFNTKNVFDVHEIRKDFPILRQTVHGQPLVWLDNAATTQKPQSVIEAIQKFYAHDNSNIHRGAHSLAARATDAYEQARQKIQRFLKAASPEEIIFVRGTTEGINLVAQTYGRKFLQPGDEIVLSVLEHHANIVPWQMIAQEKGAILRVIPVNDRGEILLEEYQKLLGPRTKLVSLSHASNSLGTLLPIQEMIALAKRYGARVLIDGAQSVAHLPIDVQQLDCDFFVFSGHKIFGPMGIGAVYAKKTLLELLPPWQGGGNMIRHVSFEETTYAEAPAKFEAGTPNVADAIGLGAALDYIQKIGLNNIGRYEHQLLEYGTEQLLRIKGLRLIGTAKEKVGVWSLVVDKLPAIEVGKLLNLEGIAVRAGHHCAQPSLRRFGLEATVRPSLSFYNTKEEIDRLVSALKKIA